VPRTDLQRVKLLLGLTIKDHGEASKAGFHLLLLVLQKSQMNIQLSKTTTTTTKTTQKTNLKQRETF